MFSPLPASRRLTRAAGGQNRRPAQEGPEEVLLLEAALVVEPLALAAQDAPLLLEAALVV